MRWLITGAAGFLGYHFANALAKFDGNHLYLVDAHRHGQADNAYEVLFRNKNTTRIDADLTDPVAVTQLPDADVVFHLAAFNGTRHFYESPWRVLRDSSLPTMFLLERYRDTDIQHWIYASSSEIYADGVQNFNLSVPTPENVPAVFGDLTNPRWSYGYAKGLGEVATHAALSGTTCHQTILRFHNVFGPRMGFDHFIPDFLRRALASNPLIYGANQTRAYAYVDDVVSQVLSLVEKRSQADGVFNVGSSVERRNTDVAREILELIGQPADLIELPPPPGSVDRRCPDLRALSDVIGEIRETPFNTALKETIDWYLNHN